MFQLRDRLQPIILTLTLLVIGLTALVPVQIVHASSTLVQQNNGGCGTSCSSIGVSFNSAVTSGDVVVVGVYTNALFYPTRVYDTLGSGPAGSYIQAEHSEAASLEVVSIFVATLTTSGADEVYVEPGGGSVSNVYILEVSGVTAPSGFRGGETGHDASLGTSVDAGSVSFQTGAFLLGIIGTVSSETVTPGNGFTLSPNTHTIDSLSAAQYSDPVSSPSTFPATLSSSSYWAEAAIALDPVPAPSIPEYPLGLPLLAIFMVVAYGLIKHRTRNPKNI